MTLYKWSKTAASNATADPSINWQEGQAPSSVNDSGRAMMASIAKHRDDIAGAIVTGGTATAYTVSSYGVFETLARLDGQIIAFTPHATNGATVTLNVDSLGAMPLRSAPSTELLAGTLIQGTPYVALYNSSDAVFYLQGFYGNPYNVPLAAGLDYWGSSAPNSAFAFPIGQAVSRTTYASLFALLGTTFGIGDGSTTFNLPDKRGRVSAAADPTGTILSSATMTPDGNTRGATGGSQVHTLTLAQLPTGINSSGSNSISVSASGGQIVTATGLTSSNAGAGSHGGVDGVGYSGTITSTGSNSIAVTSNNTSGNPHNNVQPTIVCNYIIRII
ncbi:microcystin-dependent protein [Bradyrhizobium algeriense]|uniref:Microcystin-dependent protein n=1 Tax=Bradyrhizobium algeriense TaxID=634784 RepID=A0ABU8BGU4_9BRAD